MTMMMLLISNDDDDNYHHHCDHQNLSDVTEGQFNKTFTSVIYKCSCCFQTPKTMATFVNYFCKITCNSVIKLAPAVSFVFHVYWPSIYLRHSLFQIRGCWLSSSVQMLNYWNLETHHTCIPCKLLEGLLPVWLKFNAMRLIGSMQSETPYPIKKGGKHLPSLLLPSVTFSWRMNLCLLFLNDLI